MVVAVVLTPQSAPVPADASGAGSVFRRTTKLAYQWPGESWQTRTVFGPDGRARDQTTGMLTQPQPQPQPPVAERESAGGVLQRRERDLAFPDRLGGAP